MKKIMVLVTIGIVGLLAFADNSQESGSSCPGPGPGGTVSGNGNAVGSIDPNEISGPSGTGQARYVLQGEWMNYTIYFENKTNATAAAQEITVTLPMDPGLDWSTLELGEIAFGDNIDMGLNGKRHGTSSYALPGTNTSVITTVSTIDGTNLVWYLRSYDPTTVDNFPEDPRGGFLPPNNNETHCGEGRLSYRVKVADATPNGTIIAASADIQFDTNEHIETDPSWWNTVGEILEVAFYDGSEIVTNLTLIAGEPFGDLPLLADREGFKGWFMGEDGTGTNVSSEDVVPSGLKTLYAGWRDLGVSFEADSLAANEGDAILLSVKGGASDQTASVQVYLTYLTAAAADIDLKTATVDGVTPKGGIKFPLTLSWAAGEVSNRVIRIPVKADKAVEADETLLFQLAAAEGHPFGETTISKATIRDPGYVALKEKIDAGTATAAEQKTWKKLAANLGEPYVTGLAAPANGGKVTGSGYCAGGKKKVTLKATANKGYVFAGWYEGAVGDGALGDRPLPDGDPVSRLASYALAETPTNDVSLTALFITSALDKSNIVATVNGMAFETTVGGGTPTLPTNIWAGVYLEWPVAASALSATTVKVSGLPSGLKFTAKPVTSKVTSGSGKSKVTTIVTNVPANTIYGAPTAVSKTKKVKVEGEGEQWQAIPSQVKVTVTTAGKSTVDYVIELVVDAIPAFAVGSFDGWYEKEGAPNGSVTMTLAANGKLSGKVLTPVEGKGKSYSFAATSLKGILTDADGTATNVSACATLIGEQKASVPLDLVFSKDSIGIGCVDGVFSSLWSGSLWMSQNGWKRGGYVFPNFKKDITTTLDNGLTLTFKKGGAVKVAGKILGDDGATLVSASGTAQLVSDPNSEDAMFLTVYIAPTKNLANGFCQVYSVKLTGPDESNEVTGVEVRDSK